MNSRNPIISIIIPVYNISEYVTQCVKSVLAQNILKEIILVDDGSTDNSGPICDKLAEQYDCIRVIHKTNGGLSDARNVGLDAAIGDYVYFLDGDDTVIHKTLIKAVNAADAHEADVVVGGIHTIKPNSLLTAWDATAYAQFRQDRTYSGVEYISRMLPECDFRVEVARYVFRRSWLKQTGLRFPEGKYHEDEYWTPRVLLLCDKLYVCDYPMYSYNNNRDGSIMNDPSKTVRKAVDSIEICNELYSLYMRCPDKNLRAVLLDNLSWKYLAAVVNAHGEDVPDFSGNLVRCAHTTKRKIKAVVYTISKGVYHRTFAH